MKKIISTVLCLVIAMFTLVGCADDIIGDYINQYEKPTVKEKISLNLYIVCEDGTADNAKVTVAERIRTYTLDNYDTEVNVRYCSESEYSNTVQQKTAEDAENRADIFLITSKDMMDNMISQNRVADLTDYMASKEFGTLNAQIASSLIDASVITVDGKDKNYCVPNNRVLGNYEYLLIKRDTAERYYMGSESQLKAFTSKEDADAALKTLIENDIAEGILTGTYNDHVRLESTGKYEDKAYYESIGYACNVLSYPKVTAEDAFTSAFAINAAANVERAMEIIYAINTDTQLRNYLQYGISATNYIIDDETKTVTRVKDGYNDYIMNPIYTGDVFKMHYCEELGWLEVNANNGSKQNQESNFITSDT